MSEDLESSKAIEDALAESKRLMDEFLSKLDEVEQLLDLSIANCETKLEIMDHVKLLKQAMMVADMSELEIDKSLFSGKIANMTIQEIEEHEKSTLEELKNYKLQKENVKKNKAETLKQYFKILVRYSDFKS